MRRVLWFIFASWILLGFSIESMGATRLRGFPVQLEGTVDVASPLAVDLDGDGRLELLLASRNQIHGLEIDGSPVAGYPVDLGKEIVVSTPLTLGRFDEQGDLLIAFGSEDGTLYVLELNGRALPPFPKALSCKILGAPIFAEVHAGGKRVILASLASGDIIALDEQGRRLPGWSMKIDGTPATSMTWSRLAPGEPPVLLLGDDQGRMHALTAAGKPLAGFPYKAKFAMVGQPILGDLDDDGRFEIVVGSKDFKIHAIKADGSACSGFPFDTIYSASALADFDGDGVVEIVASSGDGKLYVIDGKGKLRKGFPVKLDRRLRSAPVVGDLDSDGKLEIAVGTERKGLAVVRANGRAYPGFPARFADRVDVAPLMADLSGDGLGELVAVGRDGQVSVFRMLRKGKRSLGLVWPSPGGGAAHGGRVFSNPPRYVDLKLEPENPSTTDILRLDYRFFDMDGDSEPETIIRWYRNGKQAKEHLGARELPAGKTRKGERWRFGLLPSPNGPEFRSGELRVQNTPPVAPTISLVPNPVRTRDDLKVRIQQESADPDGDRIRYRYAWLKDRRIQKGLRGDKISAKRTRKGERWTVVVTPNDGEVSGAAARVSTTISNTPPDAAAVSLRPKRPRVTDQIKVQVDRPGRDADGDRVSYRFDWRLDGVPLDVPRSASFLPASFGKKNGKIEVDVVSIDGSEEGKSVRGGITIVNTPPTAPKIRIVPLKPTTRQDLRVQILDPARDPDSDALRYQVSWRKDGKEMKGAGFAGERMSSAKTRKGQRWEAVVLAADDEASGPEARAEVSIVNSAPVAPRLEHVQARPVTTEPLVLKVLKAPVDPDGDATWCNVRWSQKGRLVAEGKNLFVLPAAKTTKHGLYEVQIIATDGQLSAPALTLSFLVRNSPPGKCRVSLEPVKPKTGQSLQVKLAEAVRDPDGDKLRMHYMWFLDGAPRPKLSDGRLHGKHVKRGQSWQVVAEADDGELRGPTCSARVLIGNLPPTSPSIRIEPAKPKVGDRLSLVMDVVSRDPDGDPLTLDVNWLVDGRGLASGTGLNQLPAGLLRKGQQWQVTVMASDGSQSSVPVTAKAVVGNSPPGRVSVGIFPKKPLSSDDLHCRLLQSTPDPDGDVLRHSFSWFKGEDKGRAEHVGATLPSSRTRRGQLWTCEVQANDGQVNGPVTTSQIKVANAKPGAPKVDLGPPKPGDNQELRCQIMRKAEDPDGDSVRYRFRWLKDGVVQSFAPGTDRVPARLTKANDIWQCIVVASDGELEGPIAESSELLIRKEM
ncbi:MAG: VCBS repeat-containing protein [Deltaproteobacteria bacterium]|nr:VCBS repeat-containing protein [Deltaproteobacteria bacterium]